MATGILSVGLQLTGHETISRVVLVPAGARLATAADPHGALHWALPLHGTLCTLTLVLLAANLAGSLVLLYAELRRPRTHYDSRRWATVFPLGMTAVACLATASAADLPSVAALGRVLLWVAVAAWLLTAYGALRSRMRRE